MTASANPKNNKNPRRLQQAVDYVGRQWFPISPNVVGMIQKKLSENSYGNEHQNLISDLKYDLSLFSYCLKQIKENSLSSSSNPLDAFFDTNFDALKELLLKPSREFSKHDLSGAEPGQAMRLKCTALSCSAADMLSIARRGNNDLAFTCALLRQLGLNLIAWNYPTIYGRALTMVKSAQSTLDEILCDSLGFEPSDLAEELVLHREAHPVVRKAIGLAPSVLAGKLDFTKISLPGKHADPHLVDICEISHAFSQLNDPEHNPNISRTYGTVIAQIDQYLGAGGSELIMNAVNAKFVTYVSRVAEVIKSDVSLENSMAKVAVDYTNKLFEQNAYAQRCTESLKKELREVYRHISRGQVSAMGVGYLVNKVIPSAGFHQGCVYLLDNKSMNLIPKLRIGPCSLQRYKAINCTLVSPESSPIVEALYCTTPIKQAGIFIHGDMVSPILGPIGSKEPMGVLYLEMSKTLQDKPDHDCLVMFKAIRDCLNDCLNL